MNRALQAWKEISFPLLFEDISDLFGEFFLSLLEYLKDTVEHLILACIAYTLICIFLYLCIIKWKCLSFIRESRNSRRVLFVTAHPDDECMFFGPTILHFTRKKDCIVYLICLSTGKNYGMSSIRKKELYRSCEILGIDSSNIFIHDHTLLPDAMDVRWPTELISEIVSRYVESLNITTIITFDRYGVSYHNNHTSIYYAVANLILDRNLPKCCGVYVLETTNVLRKYWLFLDIPLSFLFSRFRYMVGFDDRDVIHKAMKRHKSQLMWFRRLYMYFSRYMLINTLQQMNLVDIELDLEIDD
ncbi:phosphatidylinositol glycan anchor biosynthesis class L [Leptinotarsa decemlineata]|uniref:phosphatidylinositol glycan anchor biosynthesis class L n=1 Tax=Leptinotarsa decemlineata TaxID=7539 RepID=UPI000C255943|nr:N-acetylglucosaminyl-phosphatidylinositol de-N-acetylase [Leptinotarsa decemlineata]